MIINIISSLLLARYFIFQKVPHMAVCYALPLYRILVILVASNADVSHHWICRNYYNIFVGQAWVRLQGYDLLGQGTGYDPDIQDSGWPASIDDCLANCTESVRCRGITYAHTWSLAAHRCHFKKPSRWKARTFNPNSCCDHYELTRGHEGEIIEVML